ncbi:MAG: hypothetical protein PHH13_00920 [Candidatus Peribacteraceae bacterium]|nr:hypothetical protein [Candidatus Peribacteraceae bacterium]
MSTALTAEHPPSHDCDAPVEIAPAASQRQESVMIQKYSVTDVAFLQCVASTLMQRCFDRQCVIPEEIVSDLNLPDDSRHAIGMKDALLAITDPWRRREVLCQMIHVIVRLR